MLVDVLVLAFFGLGWKTDAYFVAWTVPTLMITVLSVLASQVVQPLFIHAQEDKGDQAGWQVLDLVITGTSLAVIPFATVGALLSPLIVRVQSPGLGDDPLALATRISWLLFLVLPLYCPVAILASTLYRFGSFALPASITLIQSASRLVFLVAFHRQLGVFALAWGTLAGVLIELFAFYWALRTRGYRYHWFLSLRHPLVSRGWRMLRYPVAAQFVGIGVEVANNALGSLTGAGGISALRLATRIVESLSGLFANSIVTAVKPTLTGELAAGHMGQAKESVRHALHLLLLVTVPLSIWLAVMGQPLLALLYERRNVTASDVSVLSTVLILMIPYVFLSRLLALTELVFFGRCDTKTPFLIAMLVWAVSIGASLALFPRFQLYAMPAARSLSYFIGGLVMLYLAHRDLGGLGLRSLWSSTSRILLSSLAMAVFTLSALKWVEGLSLSGFTKQVVQLGVPSLAGSLILLLALTTLRVIRGDALYWLCGLRWVMNRT
jgi:putative peptidoglycan lipid II flippase